ncbi:hypothetical protein [Salipaludibacillus sp. CF4.18]|uniref:hypothetical protein n=1 Tax=Salipaludibacillus sp. CF4.18 TaxID=3373081 RepID=UPI003EE7E4E2
MEDNTIFNLEKLVESLEKTAIVIEGNGNNVKGEKEVQKYWVIEVLKGYNNITDEINYAVRLTSLAEGQSVIFFKQDLEDTVLSKKLQKKLGQIGKIRPNYLKVISNCIEDAIFNQREKVIQVEDIRSIVASDITIGVSVSSYYKIMVDCYKNNPHDFPTKSSGIFDKYKHKGCILDDQELGKDGHYPIAIITGELRHLLVIIRSDNAYHDVLKDFIIMGVMHADKDDGKLSKVRNYGKSKNGKKATVFIFDINLSLSEGGK